MSKNSRASQLEELLFFDHLDYFSRLISDVASAKHRVLIESYIFALDRCGVKLLRALLDAASKGVGVYLMVDGVGSLEYIAKLNRIIEKTPIHFKIFHPLPWQLQQVRWYSFIPVLAIKLVQGIAELNSRNHRKCCIIDDRTLYTGSFNVISSTPRHKNAQTASSVTNANLNPHNNSLCDIGVRVAGDGLEVATEAFMAAWKQRKTRKTWREVAAYLKGNPWIRLNHFWYQRFGLRRAMLKRLRHAQKRILITNAYFVPDSRFMRALLEVASKGVEIKILLPHQSDVSFMPIAARTFYQRMLSCGIQIYEYMPAILHAKTLIIDDWMIIGSSNLNHRSLLHDLELDIVLRDPREKHRLVEDFNGKLTCARRVDLADLVRIPWWKKLVGNLLLWMRYWL